MSSEKTKHSNRKGVALALAAGLLLATAGPAAAGPRKADLQEIGAAPLLKVWEGVWGWLTAVWGEQGNAIDPDGATSTTRDQGHMIDPDGAKRTTGEQGHGIDPNGVRRPGSRK